MAQFLTTLHAATTAARAAARTADWWAAERTWLEAGGGQWQAAYALLVPDSFALVYDAEPSLGALLGARLAEAGLEVETRLLVPLDAYLAAARPAADTAQAEPGAAGAVDWTSYSANYAETFRQWGGTGMDLVDPGERP